MEKSQAPSIAAGMRVLCRDAEWLVTRVTPADHLHRNKAIHCVGADDLVRGQERIFLEKLDVITPVDPRNTKLVSDQSSGYRMARLFLEAQLRQMPMTDTTPDLIGMGVFKPMEYQKKAVHHALLELRPRLLLADAVGLGKTIEVGMIITELMRRGRADRILVLAKKSMLTQFQSELWNRFGIPLVRMDSEGIARLRLRIPANKNPFEVYHRIIISIDTLKDVGRYRHFLEKTRWDVVVIDEAHNVAGANVPHRHLSNRLARLLSRRTDSLILTTATPHNGKKETFGRLITLLDPSAIPDPRLREYAAEDIREFFIMRFKEDIRHEAGDNFQQREVVPLVETSAPASDQEESVFDVFGRMRQEFGKAIKGSDVDILVQYGLYKLFLSSPEACQSTCSDRIQRLQKAENKSKEASLLMDLQSSIKGLTLASSTRYALLKKQLQDIGWNGGGTSPRILVFTEYRKTQDALASTLAKDFGITYDPKFEEQPKQAIAVIHGGVPDIHLMKTVEAFGTGSSPVRMLIATDVASEGINLHHECHNIIHYDLPWSIITLIQRNGRIDRFGQKKTPYLRYLMVNSTQAKFAGDQDIFSRLIQKVEEINRSTRSGESVLKLYDPEAEERYIAEHGILEGDVKVLEGAETTAQSAEAAALEEILRQAGKDDSSLMKFLLHASDAAQPADLSHVPAQPVCPQNRYRLFTDRDFFTKGYQYLAENAPGYSQLQIDDHLITLNSPEDLKRRLGSPNMRGDVIFGATAIPMEAWPEHDHFRLSHDMDYVDKAIEAARKTAGHWSKTQLIMMQHPILQWIVERLIMVMNRGEAPYIRSPHLKDGELCFCFIGQVSSRAGTPLVVDAHAVSFEKGGGFRQRPLAEALEEAKVHNLVNSMLPQSTQAAQLLISAAVETSLEHMRSLKLERDRAMAPLLRKELRRLRDWQRKRKEFWEQMIAELPPNNPRAHHYKREIEEMESYLKDREKNWESTYFDAEAEPTTRLVLVIEGGKVHG